MTKLHFIAMTVSIVIVGHQ